MTRSPIELSWTAKNHGPFCLWFVSIATKPSHFPIWISYWNLSSYIPVAPFLDRIEFLRQDLNFFRRPGNPRNLGETQLALLMIYEDSFKHRQGWNSIWSKFPEWRLKCQSKTSLQTACLNVDQQKIYWAGAEDVCLDRTGQKAIDCCCYRSQPAHPLLLHRCLV